ncbi:MAG: transposase [Arenimonas sp.]|nr:transposase [Arenimonas sp.]
MPHPDASPGYQQLRAGRCSELGRAYFLTTVTHQRAPLFQEWANGCLMSRLISNRDTWAGATLLAWVLMPDHWHGIVVLDKHITLSKLMKRAKGTSAHAFNRQTGRQGPVWRDGFHDRAIRRDEGLRAVARYIVANPIRAGLVDTVGDYPFWDAAWLSPDTPCAWEGL